MSDLSKLVDSLENRISELLSRHENLKKANAELEEELAFLQSKQQQFENEIESWVDKYNSLKVANSMLGSDQYKRDTKLKINALIREIDHCITQLSE